MKQQKLSAKQTTTTARRPSEVSKAIGKTATHPVLQLQADIGNQKTNDRIEQQSRQNTGDRRLIQTLPMFGGLSGELSGGNPIQTKLSIGTVGDKYEQEADRIAAEVTSRLNESNGEIAPESHSSDRPEAAPAVQKKTTPSPIQRTEGSAYDPELETSIKQAKGRGESLPKPLQTKMEQAFGGADFSAVKIHTGTEGDRLNRSLNARAFTTGQDIFFRQQEYNPGSDRGQELLAHELTHVLQQNGQQVQHQFASGATPVSATQSAQANENLTVQRREGDEAHPKRRSKNPQERAFWRHGRRETIRDNSVSSGLSKIGPLIDMAVPLPGDKSKLEVDLEVPIEGGFVGFNLTFESERNANNSVKTAMKFLLTGGAGISVVKLKGKLGGYVEALGQDSKHAMTLISYGFYRRLRESSAVPREITNQLWGGSSSSAGYEDAEQWGAGVEMGLLESSDDNLYAETSGVAGVEAGGSIGVAKVSGELEYTEGRRTNKASIQNLKLKKYLEQKGQSALNQADITDPTQKEQIEEALIATTPTLRGGQKKSGEGIRAVKATVKGDATLIGGAGSLKVIWETKNREKEVGIFSDRALKYNLKGWDLQIVEKITIPLTDLGSNILIEKLVEWVLKSQRIVTHLKSKLKKDESEWSKDLGVSLDGVGDVADIASALSSSGKSFKPEIKLPKGPKSAGFKSNATLEVTFGMKGNLAGPDNSSIAVRLVKVQGLVAPNIKALVERKQLIFQYQYPN